MEVELLKKIARNTEHKTSFQIIVSDNKTSFNTRFTPKIELDRDKVLQNSAGKFRNLLLVSKHRRV